MDLFFRETKPRWQRLHGELRRLDWPIDFSTVCRNMCEAVYGFHCIVSQIGRRVTSFDNLCCILKCRFGITIFAKNIDLPFCHFRHSRFVALCTFEAAWNFYSLLIPSRIHNDMAVWNLFPFYAQRFLCIHYFPRRVSYYDAQLCELSGIKSISFPIIGKGFNSKNILDSWQRSRCVIVHRFHL